MSNSKCIFIARWSSSSHKAHNIFGSALSNVPSTATTVTSRSCKRLSMFKESTLLASLLIMGVKSSGSNIWLAAERLARLVLLILSLLCTFFKVLACCIERNAVGIGLKKYSDVRLTY